MPVDIFIKGDDKYREPVLAQLRRRLAGKELVEGPPGPRLHMDAEDPMAAQAAAEIQVQKACLAAGVDYKHLTLGSKPPGGEPRAAG